MENLTAHLRFVRRNLKPTKVLDARAHIVDRVKLRNTNSKCYSYQLESDWEKFSYNKYFEG